MGVLDAVAAAPLFGVSTPVARLLLRSTHPVALASLLYLGAGLSLALWALAPGASWGRPPTRAERPRLVAPIALGGVAGPLLLLLGLRVVPATTAALLSTAMPKRAMNPMPALIEKGIPRAQQERPAHRREGNVEVNEERRLQLPAGHVEQDEDKRERHGEGQARGGSGEVLELG